MSSAELTEWMQFEQLEPFGGDSRYLGAAIVAATIANALRDSSSALAKPEDFIPKFGAQEQSLNEQLELVTGLAQAYGEITYGND